MFCRRIVLGNFAEYVLKTLRYRTSDGGTIRSVVVDQKKWNRTTNELYMSSGRIKKLIGR